jgi:transglutaminase-like putative cysteine protease
MRLSVIHETRYQYASMVGHAHHLACLQPRSDERQRCEAFALSIDPAHGPASVRTDAFGNHQHWFELCVVHDSLRVLAESVVHTTAGEPLADLALGVGWQSCQAQLQYSVGQPYCAAAEFAHPSPMAPTDTVFAEFARPSFPPGLSLVEAAMGLMARLHAHVRYEPGSTQVHTPARDALQQRRGVCQDLAHIMVACLRSMGLAARYVSGYMLTDPPPGQPRLLGADASHAWVQVWVPRGEGDVAGNWLELDPTNNQVVDERYVRAAIGRDYGDAAPLRGVIRGGGDHQAEVSVTVSLIGQA